MSQPDDLRAEFEAFRDETRESLQVLASIQEDEDVARRQYTRALNALRETQIDHGLRLDAQHTTLLSLARSVGALVVGQEELKTDVAELKTDVAGLKTDVSDLKSGQAAILRILDERLPGRAD
jgi:chromosome segregation ATPase